MPLARAAASLLLVCLAASVANPADAQRPPVLQILFDPGVPVEGVDVDLGAVGDDLGLEFPTRRASPPLAAFEDQLHQLRATDVEVVGHHGFEEPAGMAGSRGRIPL